MRQDKTTRLADDRLALEKAEAGRVLSVSSKTIERLIASGKLRAQRIGRRVVIPVAELNKLLAE